MKKLFTSHNKNHIDGRSPLPASELPRGLDPYEPLWHPELGPCDPLGRPGMEPPDPRWHPGMGPRDPLGRPGWGPPDPRDPLGYRDRPAPPRFRRNIPLDEQEMNEITMMTNQAFQDGDSAVTALQIFQEVAPPEIQVLIFQIGKLYTKLAPYFAQEREEEFEEEQRADETEFGFESDEPSPRFTILDPAAKALVAENYGEKGRILIEALRDKPNEIVEANILLAWLYKKVPAKEEG